MPKTSGKKEFQWTDDEAELLLNVTHEYKVQKISENVDWESVKAKYDDILVLMKAALPSTPEEVQQQIDKDYPHTKDEITKQILSTKLKSIRLKFRQAVDSGRRSGHGRVVLLYYELCEKVWGGSPATNQIDGGVESTDISSFVQSPSSSSSSTSDPLSNEHVCSDSEAENDGEQRQPDNTTSSDNLSTPEPVQQRRELLDRKLTNYKQEKMKRKLPVDAQLLHCAKEELEMKKKCVEQMDRMEQKHNDNMASLSSNLEKLTNSITEGFSLLRNILAPQPGMYPTYPQPAMFNAHHYSDATHSCTPPNSDPSFVPAPQQNRSLY